MFKTGFTMDLQFHSLLGSEPAPANPPGGDPPPAPPANPPGGDPPPAPPTPPAPAPPTNPPAPKPDEKEQKPTAGAPEKYEDFKLPEGMNMDTAGLEKAVELFKKHGLSQEAAQEFVTFEAERIKAQMDAFKQTVAGWEQETIKRLGPNYKEELSFGARFRDQFLSPATIKLFEETGLFNHPDVVTDFIKAGKAMAEDKFVPGYPAKQEVDKMKTFFPNSQIPEK